MSEKIVQTVEFTEKLITCEKEGKSSTECLVEGVKDGVSSLVKETIVSITGKAGQLTSDMVEIHDVATQCVADGHNRDACNIGAVVNVGMTHITRHMSEAVITASVGTPSGMITGPVGIYTLLKSDDIGRTFGGLTIKMVDYLIDHVPAEMIDTSRPVQLRNNDTIINFNQSEIKFIQKMVGMNQAINKATTILRDDTNIISNNMSFYVEKSRKHVRNFNVKTGEIMMDLSHNNNLIQNLNQITHDISHEQINTINDSVSHIRTDKLCEQIDRNVCINLHQQALFHNSKINETTHAEIRYDSSRGHGGEWKIVFTVFTFSFGGPLGSSGSFCTLL